MARLRVADIVLASPRTTQLSLVALLYRVFLRARYVHSMLYIGGGKVIHTTARRGVVVDRLPRTVFRRDRYTIYRARDLTPEQRDGIVREALASLDRKLDHAALVTNIPSRWLGLHGPLLRMEENRVWCSRLICTAFAKNGIELVPADRSDVITSEDLSRSPALEQI
jgi:hypothetical protein